MVRRFAVLMSAILITVSSVSAAKWEVDGAHSSVNFSVKHLVISKVTGKFADLSGTLVWDGEKLETGKSDLTVQMASVSTENEKRDGHLKGPDFFDVEKFPTMNFKSTKVLPGKNDNFKLVGNLTIRDVTKEVTFDCEFHGKANFMNMTKAGFSALAEIDRQEYGVSWSKSMDTGGLVVGDNVKINLELEFNQVTTELTQE